MIHRSSELDEDANIGLRLTIVDPKEDSVIAVWVVILEIMDPESSETKTKANGIIEDLIKAYVDMGLSGEKICEKTVAEVRNTVDLI